MHLHKNDLANHPVLWQHQQNHASEHQLTSLHGSSAPACAPTYSGVPERRSFSPVAVSFQNTSSGVLPEPSDWLSSYLHPPTYGIATKMKTSSFSLRVMRRVCLKHRNSQWVYQCLCFTHAGRGLLSYSPAVWRYWTPRIAFFLGFKPNSKSVTS